MEFYRNTVVISLILCSIRDDQGILLSVYSGTLALPKETPGSSPALDQRGDADCQTPGSMRQSLAAIPPCCHSSAADSLHKGKTGTPHGLPAVQFYPACHTDPPTASLIMLRTGPSHPLPRCGPSFSAAHRHPGTSACWQRWPESHRTCPVRTPPS